MYMGEPTSGKDFFTLLVENEEFCAQLGRMILAAGKLETLLSLHLENLGEARNLKKKTLGQLISMARNNNYDNNLIDALEMLKTQRNYLTHNISLLSGHIKKTILESEDLLDSDIQTYCGRAWVLTDNLNGISNIMLKELRTKTT